MFKALEPYTKDMIKELTLEEMRCLMNDIAAEDETNQRRKWLLDQLDIAEASRKKVDCKIINVKDEV